MPIQAKKRPIIQNGLGFVYNEEMFKDHIVENFYEIADPKTLLKLVKPFELDGRKYIVFDTETHPHYTSSHLVPKTVVRRWVGSGKTAIPQDYPFEISIFDGTNAYAIYDSLENNFAKFKQLAPLFEDPTIDKIAHNTKFDMHMFANAGLSIKGRLHDTVVLAKLVDENRGTYTLLDVARKLSKGVTKFEYMVDNYKQINRVHDYREIPKQLLSTYANADVQNCYYLFMNDYPKLKQDDLEALYLNECELMVALYAMERYGMKIDSTYEMDLKTTLQKLCDEAEEAVYAEAGVMFNMNSTQQLFKVLTDLGVNSTIIPKTEKGNPCLDKDVLGTLAECYNISIVNKILEYKKNFKLLGTYANGIYSQRDAEYCVHSSINQTEATTGRMSITKPALQTLPKTDTRIRSCFIPDNDYSLWFMDLDQIEYRLFAHYAQAKGLLEAINNNFDIHSATAAILFHKDIKDVTDEERAKAKTTNFALIYGQGNEHTATMLKMSMTETIAFKNNYFAQIPEARPFIATVHEVIKMRAFVKNFYGRRRRLARHDSYKAPNALIQGCAADYIKHKLVDMFKYISYHGLKTKLINIVHDEVVLMVHKDEHDHIPVLRWLLSDFTSFRCKITAGVAKGLPHWGKKEEVSTLDFQEPKDKAYLQYDVFNGNVFNIYKE